MSRVRVKTPYDHNFSKISFKICFVTVVGDFYQYNEDDFLFKFLFIISFFQITTSLEGNKEKLLINSFFYLKIFVYQCCLKDW